MTKITEAAKAGLAMNTGFDMPRVVGISMQDELYHVVVDIRDRTGGGGVVLRTYDVAVDGSGEMHGYMSLGAGIPCE